MDHDSALESKMTLQGKLIKACEGVTTGKQPFNIALKGIDLDIPEYPDVSINELKLLYSDLQHAAELEDILQGLMDADNYIQSLHDWNQLRDYTINILINPPEFLMAADPKLAHEMQERIIDLQKKVSQASSSSINTLSRDVDKGTAAQLRDFDPYQLLGKYWQLYWCLISEVIEDPAVSTSALYAIGKAQKMPRSLVDGLAREFEQIDTKEDISNVERDLSALRFFNLGLVSMPIINGENKPLVDLPPLPGEQTYPEVDPELSDRLLEDWHRIMINWLNLLGASVAGGQPDGLRTALRDSKQFYEDIQYLKKQVWPKLKLTHWHNDSHIGVLESESGFLIELGTGFDEGGLDWVNMKAMEIISYLDARSKELSLDDLDAGKPLAEFFLPYHSVLVETVSDIREKALDRIDRQVISILRDRTRTIQRMRDELLEKPQMEETAILVHNAVIQVAEDMTSEALQSGQRKDAVAVWARIKEAARPWANPRSAIRRFNELPPEVNRIWGKLYRQANVNTFKMRFSGRRREAIIAASVFGGVALITLGYIGLNIMQTPQATETQAVVLGTSTLNLPATMRFQTAAARATGLVGTSTAYAIQAQESQVAQANTSTVQAAYELASTQEADIARERTATAEEIARETEIQRVILDQTATATAQIYILRATYEAILCRNNPSFLSYEISPTVRISPDPGTRYNAGTSPFTVTATWAITNTSECRWGYLGLEPLSDEFDVTYTFLREDGEVFNLGPENTVAVSETIKIVASFDPYQVRNVNEEWILVINSQELPDFPHLELSVRNWVIPIYPPTRTPTPDDDNGD